MQKLAIFFIALGLAGCQEAPQSYTPPAQKTTLPPVVEQAPDPTQETAEADTVEALDTEAEALVEEEAALEDELDDLESLDF